MNGFPHTRRARTMSLGVILLTATVVSTSASAGPALDTRDAGYLPERSPDPGAAEPGVPPDWMKVDRSAKTVRLEIVAGKTEANNRWNFNGHSHGRATITVPVGYEVTIEFRNEDPDVPHSLGVDALPNPKFPAMFKDPEPAFEGAMTSKPTSMTESTLPGESETLTFTAAEAGDYAILCYIPAHAVTGMWIRFVVSAEGEADFEATEAGDG